MRSALVRLNPDVPDDALDNGHRRLTRPTGATLEGRNRDFHRMVVAGVTVEHVDTEGRVRGTQIRVLDFDDQDANDWLAVNRFTVVENRHERRPDIVLFINGLPLGIIELKNPVDENATIQTAFSQLQTYRAEIPSLFAFNAALIVSDGLEASHRHVDLGLGVVQLPDGQWRNLWPFLTTKLKLHRIQRDAGDEHGEHDTNQSHSAEAQATGRGGRAVERERTAAGDHQKNAVPGTGHGQGVKKPLGRRQRQTSAVQKHRAIDHRPDRGRRRRVEHRRARGMSCRPSSASKPEASTPR